MDLHKRAAAINQQIEAGDPELAKELRAVRRKGVASRARVVAESLEPGREEVRPQVVAETIVLKRGRPVLTVSHDEALLQFKDAESKIWKDRLLKARASLGPAIKAVGRIEVVHHPNLTWVGTGWLIAPDIIVTNRHVALEFAHGSPGQFVFRQGPDGAEMELSIDFLEEFRRSESRSFRLRRVLHIEGERGPDVAFLQVATARGAELARPIALAGQAARKDQMVAVIGYPASDSRIPDQQLMDELFGNIYNKKRLAPGQVTGTTRGSVLHNCTTSGGNSGSVLLDLASGQAVGLHYSGRYLETNFAVPSPELAERLSAATSSKGRTPRADREDASPPPGVDEASPLGTVTCTIPVRLTIDILGPLGEPQMAVRPPRITVPRPVSDEGDDFVAGAEGESVPEDYDDREGYQTAFLGVNVPLPRLKGRAAADVLRFKDRGKSASVLRYQHFSVVMSSERRMCFLSAVNIDGANSRKAKRVGWRIDPRIQRDAQIIHECYGNSPKFSRGHMTRREDPIWGTKGAAALGNSDSMHVTNVVPQMQPFNAPIWLGLEDYALQHARGDEMQISVFTGPFFTDEDPTRDGVRIPLSFWKVIAFIHDETGELCATGYTMSQEDALQPEEFVFGAYKTAQLPLRTIEERASVSFGSLASRDPLQDQEEALPSLLTDFRQIRFR